MADNLTEYTYSSNPEITFNARNLTGDFKTDEDNWVQLHDYLPDTRVINVEDIKHLEGIEDFESLLSKGLFRLRPRIYASSLARFRKLAAQIKQAFNPKLTQLNSNSDEGYLPFDWTEIWDDGTTETTYYFRVYLKPVEIPRILQTEKEGTGTLFEILMKAKDPRRLSQSTKTITLNSGSLTGTDDNDGDMPTWPTITITGPTAASPKITYNEKGEYIELDDTLTTGQVVVIDCQKSTITKDGSNAYSTKADGSKFFDLEEGTITLIGENLSTGSVAIEYRDAWTL